MKKPTHDITTILRIVRAIEDDIHEYKSFNVRAAYRKNRKRRKAAQRRSSFITYLSRIAAVLFLPLLVSTGWLSYSYIRQVKQINPVSYLEASSAPGVVTCILLPDSTRVWLNAGSSLRYPSRFEEKERQVRLSGEGYFQVKSDKEHPFYVMLNNGIIVKAHGTRFNISAYEEDRITETTLETGRVDVIAGPRSISLKPNEQVSYDESGQRFTVSSVSTDEKTAWKEGKLIFRNATLEEVVKKLSRKYNIDIVLHRESRNDYKFRATFSSEPVAQILDYLRMAAPISWSYADTKQQQDYTYPRQRIDIWLK